MKIAMVAWSFYPRVGGSLTCVRELSEQLLARGIEVEIIAPLLRRDIDKKEGLDLGKKLRMHWLTSPFAKSYTDFYSRFIFFFKFVKKIKSLSTSIDIFHTHDFNISLLSTIISTKKPIVATFGADPLFETIYFKKKRCIDYHLFLEKKIIHLLQRITRVFIKVFSRNRLVIVSFNENVNQIIKKYTLEPIVNIPIGINLELFRKNKTESRTENNMILVVARFVPWKGIDLAMDVFKQIKKHKSEARIVFIGGGPLADYYLDKYRNLQGVSFIVNLNYKAIVEYYKKASVLLVTSQYETLGNNITEAMAAGLPIVATDLSVFHDRLVDNFNGYLVKDNDVMAFSEKVLTLMDDYKIRERFITNASAIVANYDINKISKRYIDLYNSLLPSYRSPRYFLFSQ